MSVEVHDLAMNDDDEDSAEVSGEVPGEGVRDHEWLDNSERSILPVQKTRFCNSISGHAEMFDSAKAVWSLWDAVA